MFRLYVTCELYFGHKTRLIDTVKEICKREMRFKIAVFIIHYETCIARARLLSGERSKWGSIQDSSRFDMMRLVLSLSDD